MPFPPIPVGLGSQIYFSCLLYDAVGGRGDGESKFVALIGGEWQFSLSLSMKYTFLYPYCPCWGYLKGSSVSNGFTVKVSFY